MSILAATQPSNALTNALTARDLDELPKSHLLQLERLLQELTPLVHSAVAKQRDSASSAIVDARSRASSLPSDDAAAASGSDDKAAMTGIVEVEKVDALERETSNGTVTDEAADGASVPPVQVATEP